METLTLQPRYHSALWGGRRLAGLPGAPAQGPIAEAWLVSAVSGRPTVIADGPRAGVALGNFPLLVKLIDAELPLSVQVHPDDAKARELAGLSNGKTEAWIVLHAEPGSRIYAGLRDGVGERQLRDALAAGRAEDVLHSFVPKPGDGVFLPAGVVHALGGGIVIFEVQQSSDLTYRLHDWNRVDAATGRPRELHVEQAMACTDFRRGPVEPLRGEPLTIECPYFRLTAHRQAVTLGGDGAARVLAAWGGPVRGCVDVRPGQAVVVPEMTGECRLTPDAGAWLLECVIPDA
jgi:mannose-6-phosphate isomerase